MALICRVDLTQIGKMIHSGSVQKNFSRPVIQLHAIRMPDSTWANSDIDNTNDQFLLMESNYESAQVLARSHKSSNFKTKLSFTVHAP